MRSSPRLSSEGSAACRPRGVGSWPRRCLASGPPVQQCEPPAAERGPPLPQHQVKALRGLQRRPVRIATPSLLTFQTQAKAGPLLESSSGPPDTRAPVLLMPQGSNASYQMASSLPNTAHPPSLPRHFRLASRASHSISLLAFHDLIYGHLLHDALRESPKPVLPNSHAEALAPARLYLETGLLGGHDA